MTTGYDTLSYNLNSSRKVLYSCILLIFGLGYIFAMIHVYESHSGRDGEPGLSLADIKIAYRGDNKNTKLEAALNGAMRGMLPEKERNEIVKWARGGSKTDVYQNTVKPILETRCYICHNGRNPHLPNLSEIDTLKSLSETDHGMSLNTLVKVSHIHLFGLTFIFGFMGLIFSHTYTRHLWLKNTIIIIPFAAIVLDVASWYLTKVSDMFSFTVIAGGAFMGMSFAYQWAVSMYQMWWFKCKDASGNCKPR